MSDVAVLGLEVRSGPVRNATVDLAKLEATAAKMERAALQLGASSSRAFEMLEQSALRANARVRGSIGQVTSSFGGLVKLFGASFLGNLAAGGLVGIAGNLGKVADSVARIGDEAKKAGIDAKAFQEWAYAANQLRVPMDAVTSGFTAMNDRASEFALTGKGAGAEAFRGLGFGADELKSKLQAPSELMLEVIQRLGQFDRASQIRLADKIFGGSGEKFVQLIDQGAGGIRQIMNEANSLGLVMDDSLIKRADEVNRRFTQIADTVGSRLKSAIVSAADSLASFMDGWNRFQDQQTSSLDSRLAEIGKQRLDIENQVLRLKNGEKPGDGLFGTSIGASTPLEMMTDLQRANSEAIRPLIPK